MGHFNGYLLIYLGLGLAALAIHSFAAHSAHIIVSLVAFIILAIAALQAMAITLQNFLLKQRPANTYPLLQFMPPVETLRNLLFKTLWAGFVFLSVSFLGAFIFLPNVLETISMTKLVLSVLAWSLFAAMLYGYQRFGWRNDVVSIRAFVGVLLLTAAYFGSKLCG